MKNLLVCFLVAALLLGIRSIVGAEVRDIVKVGGDFVVEDGMRVSDVVTIGGHVTVKGMVDGDVVIVAGSVSLGPKAIVRGDVVSVGGTIEKDEGAEVHGNLVEVNIPGISSFILSVFKCSNWQAPLWAFRIIRFIGFLALSLLIAAIIPKPVSIISGMVEKNVLKVSLWGLLSVALIVPLAIILAVSVVGLVLIPLEIILVICAFLIGYIAVAQLIGKKMTAALKRPDQPLLCNTLWGLIILWVIGWVPVLAWLVKAVVMLLGLGAVTASLVAAIKCSNTESNLEC